MGRRIIRIHVIFDNSAFLATSFLLSSSHLHRNVPSSPSLNHPTATPDNSDEVMT